MHSASVCRNDVIQNLVHTVNGLDPAAVTAAAQSGDAQILVDDYVAITGNFLSLAGRSSDTAMLSNAIGSLVKITEAFIHVVSTAILNSSLAHGDTKLKQSNQNFSKKFRRYAAL
jgi:hypothetical protein